MADPVNIVFLDRATLPAQIVLRAPEAAHRLTAFDRTEPGEVADRIAEADVVITNKVPVDAAAVAGAKRLRLIAVAATGYDVIDVGACAAAGIAVSNVRGYAINTVPEHTFALILALRRSILAYHRSLANGRWVESGQFCYFDHPINNLAGSTLGVVGDGAIGRAVAKVGEAFGMRVLFSAYKGTSGMGPLYTPFETVLRDSDVITLHCPLTPSTRNLIGPAEFAAMERRPLVVNTARGGLVDEEALVAALDGGQISGAGFDVATVEPMPADHPLMALVGRPNVVLTPHVAWASHEAVQALADQVIDNIDAFLAGAARHVVTPPAA